VATIVSHRGLWTTPEQGNSLAAIEAGFEHGFGLETDIRDCRGELLVSHDPPTGDEVTLAQLLTARRRADAGPLALNVKADGLQAAIEAALGAGGDPEYFVFDMSIPDTLGYRRAGLRYFTRQSEYEPEPALYCEAAGVWLDCFETAWFEYELIAGHLAADKQVCVVSPELHGRDHRGDWKRWSGWDVFDSPDVLLCTDRPIEASKAFAAT
jgi:glycerophosphoryl diester phosphodiesterase